MPKIIKTFNEWKNNGYRIHRGSKCVGFKDNQPLFDRSQVYTTYSNNYTYNEYNGRDYNNYSESELTDFAKRSPELYMDMADYSDKLTDSDGYSIACNEVYKREHR